MLLKYDIEIDKEAINLNIGRLINQIYKLLPVREEGGNWQILLANIFEELSGMSQFITEAHPTLFRLCCKLEGLCLLLQEADFKLFRSTVFDCIGLLEEIRKNVELE